MGVYLSKPIKDKLSTDTENDRLRCGASSMQGWRVSQEDAHNCFLDFDSDCSLFAVYDGHGGHDVADYTAANFPNFLKNHELYKRKEFDKALVEAFLGFDETLKSKEVIDELKKIAASRRMEKSPNDSGDVDEDSDEAMDNVEKLKEEADMPITDVMAQYARLAKTPVLRRLANDKKKPQSPFLKAKLIKPDSSDIGEVTSSKVDDQPNCLVNGLKDVSERNGDVNETKCTSSESSCKAKDDVPSSSQNGELEDVKMAEEVSEEKSSSSLSQQNTDEESVKKKEVTEVVAGSSGAGDRAAKRKAAASMYHHFETSDTSEDSDSENDESFQATSDEDENGNEGDEEEAAEEAEGGEENEEEEEEDDDDDDEEEVEEEEDDSEDEDLEESFDLKELDEPGKDSGCTAVVVLVLKDELYVANAGDSRAVLCRNGEAVDMSLDHKPEDGPEMERIVAAGGRVTADGRVNGGLNLSRALGDHTYKQESSLSPTEQMIIALPDIKKEKLDLSMDEFLVLACDGIWNSLTSQEVVDFVRPLIAKGEKLSEICEKLFEECLAPDTLGDGTGCDNMTCIIIHFLGGDSVKSVSDQPNGEHTSKRPSSPIDDISSKKPKLDSDA